MQELNLRLGQAVALTYAQTDDNFKRLKTAIDALEVSVAGAGLGTVTSVGLALPNIFTVSNSPVISAGTLTATLASQSANVIFASPTSVSGQPTFRSLVAADLGVITVPVTNGGTGLSTIATANQVLSSNLAGGAYEGRTITPSGGLTVAFAANLITLGLNPALINITDFAGTLTAAKGGTGFTGPFAVNQILLGNGSSSWTSAVLTAGSGISITNDVGLGTVTIANTAAVVSALNTLTGSVYIGFGSSGTDLNVTTPTTSDITLNIPSASASNRGVLTSADWTTFNNKLGGSGTASYIPKFTASGTVGNSVLYEGLLGNVGKGTTTPIYDFHIVDSNATLTLESPSGVGTFRILNTGSGTTSSLLLTTGLLTTTNIDFTINTGHKVYASGNVQVSKGFALSGFEYWNTASNYVFSSNEQYGVILGPTSPGTMTVTLPTTPMEGQEVCVLCEEAKTLTLIATGSTIFGHNAGVNIDVIITGGTPAGAASIIVKYAGAANGGLGAWFITGL